MPQLPYTTASNETFETVSRRVYGHEGYADLLREANPGLDPLDTGGTSDVLSTPLPPGASLYIPPEPGEPIPPEPLVTPVNEERKRFLSEPAPDRGDGTNTVILRIGGVDFPYWTSFSLDRAVGSFSRVSVEAPYNVDDETFKSLFTPLSFTPVEVLIGGVTSFTGRLLSPEMSTSKDADKLSVEAYSMPATLNNCMMPASALPLEFEGQSLAEITEALTRAHGISVRVNGDIGPTFNRVGFDASAKIVHFLIPLAKQRGIQIADTPGGNCLLHTPAEAGRPVARLAEGQVGVESVSVQYNDDEWYSSITGIQSLSTDFTSGRVTVINPHLRGINRPFTFKVQDTQGGDLQTAVEAMAGRMIAGAVQYTVSVSAWRDTNGDLWRPNTTVVLRAPGARVHRDTEFLIRQVVLTRKPAAERAVLTLVLPGAYSGEIPERMPWQ